MIPYLAQFHFFQKALNRLQQTEPQIKTYTIKYLSSEIVLDKMKSQFSTFMIEKFVRKKYKKYCCLTTHPLNSVNLKISYVKI